MSKALIFRVTLENATIKSWIEYKAEKSKGLGNMG